MVTAKYVILILAKILLAKSVHPVCWKMPVKCHS